MDPQVCVSLTDVCARCICICRIPKVNISSLLRGFISKHQFHRNQLIECYKAIVKRKKDETFPSFSKKNNVGESIVLCILFIYWEKWFTATGQWVIVIDMDLWVRDSTISFIYTAKCEELIQLSKLYFSLHLFQNYHSIEFNIWTEVKLDIGLEFLYNCRYSNLKHRKATFHRFNGYFEQVSFCLCAPTIFPVNLYRTSDSWIKFETCVLNFVRTKPSVYYVTWRVQHNIKTCRQILYLISIEARDSSGFVETTSFVKNNP